MTMNQFLHSVIGLILTFSIQTLHSQSHAFEHIHIGSKWTYETAEYLIPLVRYDAMTFVITDTSAINGKSIFVVENNLDNKKEYIRLDGDSLFYWDEALQVFQLNFVFDTIDLYESRWAGQCHTEEGKATIHVDSITSRLFGQDTLAVQHVTITDNGSTEDDMKREIYVGIGQNSGGLKLQLGRGFCDFYFSVTQLRCFESNIGSYNFVGYECDSTWLDLNLATREIEEDDVLVYQNPGLNLLAVEVKGLDARQLRFDLVDARGVIQFSKHDISSGFQIPSIPAGQYVYRIFRGDKLITVGTWVKL